MASAIESGPTWRTRTPLPGRSTTASTDHGGAMTSLGMATTPRLLYRAGVRPADEDLGGCDGPDSLQLKQLRSHVTHEGEDLTSRSLVSAWSAWTRWAVGPQGPDGHAVLDVPRWAVEQCGAESDCRSTDGDSQARPLHCTDDTRHRSRETVLACRGLSAGVDSLADPASAALCRCRLRGGHHLHPASAGTRRPDNVRIDAERPQLSQPRAYTWRWPRNAPCQPDGEGSACPADGCRDPTPDGSFLAVSVLVSR